MFDFVPASYIYAQIRDSAGNRMPVASRIECCIGAECLAVFESRSADVDMLECYGVFGSSFLVFAGRTRFRLLGRRFSYTDHCEVEEIDRFALGTITFAELLRVLYWDRAQWWCTSIDSMLARLLDHVGPEHALSPVQLNFITLNNGLIGV